MQDTSLETNIQSLQRVIKDWAEKYDIWDSSSFGSWIEHWDEEPYQEDPCILMLFPDGDLSRILYLQDNELYEEFEQLLQKFGCYYTLYDYGKIEIVLDDEELKKAYRNYFEWQWICGLIEPDFSDLYEEVYEWFHKYPDYLYHLNPRKFEVFLDGVFRNNGFQTILGPRSGDGGIDIHLFYSNEVVGEIVTLVQAKRYTASNPIDLQAVQALTAAVDDARANKGLFVTTSRYLPCAKKFAARQNKRIELATSDEVSLWSSKAVSQIIKDKSQLIDPIYLERLIKKPESTNGLEGKIFHAHWGVTILFNSFAIVLRESKGAALLMELPRIEVSGNTQQGYEIPDLGTAAFSYLNEKHIFRAKKKFSEYNGEFYFWGNRKVYSLWDSNPKYYDSMD